MRKAILIFIAIMLAFTIYEVSRRGIAYRKPGVRPAAIHSPAPDFSLQDLDGQPLQLANYRGKVVLLNFWATWCGPCRGEIPHFVGLQNQYREPGFQIIGISMDDGPKPVREFYQQFKMNYPVALGTEKMAQSYGGVLGLPVTFLIGRDGQIAAKHTGEVQMPALEEEIKSLLQAK
jgi:cytochrome c biogenesis protein CcmG/thiol:disulfide interchange protein DsbE